MCCGKAGLVGSGLPTSAKRIFRQQLDLHLDQDACKCRLQPLKEANQAANVGNWLEIKSPSSCLNLPASKDPSQMTGGATSNMESSLVSDSQAPVFHGRSGQLVTLSQAGRTASRSHATQVHSLKIWKTGQTQRVTIICRSSIMDLSCRLRHYWTIRWLRLVINMVVWNSTR